LNAAERKVLACALGAGTVDEASGEETVVVQRRLVGVPERDSTCI
jgi:hypothetical protein